ncbi:LuxR family transcriptional regulator [Cupriavidus sp. HPC(L)]|uniref:response regulator n=1 Tax=Cupriavidus sp. HPC(L) TaxID=1217418 RepID=UPI00029117DC|nr:response regulator transcription factor [Cupriavidus sp. HPC(L)]ESJ12511.1 LuxR family transcriptional regulator [Cupriavidus sp. HPC(L)]
MTSNLRVLLVDDHPFVLDGVRLRLEATGEMTVVGEASNVEDAIVVAEQRRPDLVVSDIHMPDANGLQLATRFAERFPSIRIVALSMHKDPEYVRRAFALGIAAYVLKEAPAHELVTAIRTVAAGGTYLNTELQAYLRTDEPPPSSRRTLTPKEATVLKLVAEGYSNKEIAERLGTSVRTVETHRLHVRRKLQVGGRAELVKYAVHFSDLHAVGLADEALATDC